MYALIAFGKVQILPIKFLIVFMFALPHFTPFQAYFSAVPLFFCPASLRNGDGLPAVCANRLTIYFDYSYIALAVDPEIARSMRFYKSHTHHTPMLPLTFHG